MSLFLAICPPESIREKIFTTIQNKDIPEELWERKEELHITLLFLSKGNPDSEYLLSIKERLVRFPFSSFELQIGGLNLWSSKEYQILHLKIANSDELISIQSRII
ncbi:MAG TPA: 2'-5' RNA ligase family protein, partial [Leptospiraceae bacterium]|nr:2'-5' RNA ligase family protein [Leptospiraceae bacterium]